MFEWFRALHIIAVIAWMAGLLIYPRLLVYRLEAQGDPRFEAAMDKAAASTRKIILNPTMILAWLMGAAMIGHNWEYYSTQIWFWGNRAGFRSVRLPRLPDRRRPQGRRRPAPDRAPQAADDERNSHGYRDFCGHPGCRPALLTPAPALPVRPFPLDQSAVWRSKTGVGRPAVDPSFLIVSSPVAPPRAGSPGQTTT